MEKQPVEGKDFLCYFAHVHTDFRLEELKALAQLEKTSLHIYNEELHKLALLSSQSSTSSSLSSSSSTPSETSTQPKGYISSRKRKKATEAPTKQDYDLLSPFVMIRLDSEESARKILKRAILIKGFFEVWGHGKNYEELEQNLRNYPKEKTEPYVASDQTFSVKVEGFGKSKYTPEDKKQRIDRMQFLNFKGKVSLSNPNHTFWIMENFGVPAEYQADEKYGEDEREESEKKDEGETQEDDGDENSRKERRKEDTGGSEKNKRGDHPLHPKEIFFCREIGAGRRDLIDKFSLKKRKYLGTTSMDSQLSLVISNMAHARIGSLICDPFVGTGSLLVTCAHFGALTVGGDIDPKPIKGRESDKNLFTNFDQYNLRDKLIDVIISDQSRPPYRAGPLFDAIVCDPPYGIRAGARKVGKKEGKKTKPDAEIKADHIPSTLPYEVPDLIADLMDFAARMLVPDGRLVFWLPTADTYKPSDIPTHPSLTLVGNSEQVITFKWRRRLITMIKSAPYVKVPKSSLSSADCSFSNLREKIMPTITNN